MLAMLKEGTTSRNSIQIAEEQERLGANIDVGASMDRTAVSMYALMPNLDASMDLMADVIKNPAFDPQELERIRATQLTRIAAENTQRSEEHTSELQSLMRISYAVFCLKKKTQL